MKEPQIPAESPRTEVKEAGIFQKKLSFFRKKYRESRQIGDLLIDIGLGKVRIDREIQRQARGQLEFEILQTGIE